MKKFFKIAAPAVGLVLVISLLVMMFTKKEVVFNAVGLKTITPNCGLKLVVPSGINPDDLTRFGPKHSSSGSHCHQNKTTGEKYYHYSYSFSLK